ncbi:MAG TPA: ribosome maturation factor, partial [Balneolaceae bacterium]|nr:ribosome maturation factor [Balneolaceae bacterium]
MKEEIVNLAESVLAGTDFFLIDVEIKGSRTPEVWIYVDGAERGINMDECAEISDELGFLIDAHGIFPDAYRLNVSSPGLSRPLVDRRQYFKNMGRTVKVKYKDEEGYHKIQGELEDLTDQMITIHQGNGDSLDVLF